MLGVNNFHVIPFAVVSGFEASFSRTRDALPILLPNRFVLVTCTNTIMCGFLTEVHWRSARTYLNAVSFRSVNVTAELSSNTKDVKM